MQKADHRLVRNDCGDDEFGNVFDAEGARPESWPWPKGEEPISVRRSILSDCRSLFEWRNEPLARRMSHNQDELIWADHVSWYERVLQNPKRPIYIGMTPKQRIGMVRFDISDNREAEVSICMSAAAKGRGLSRRFLAEATKAFFAEHGAMPLVAEIKPENVRSVALFTKSGYEHSGGVKYVRRD